MSCESSAGGLDRELANLIGGSVYVYIYIYIIICIYVQCALHPLVLHHAFHKYSGSVHNSSSA